MILPIYTYGNKILRQKCQSIDADYPNLKELISNMFDTMYNAQGVGVSAPQIGLLIRVFIVDLTSYHAEDPSIPNIKKVFINPEIIEEYSPEIDFNEGCLSIPGIREDVIRKNKIKVKYFDEKFTPITETISGFYARVYQHEYDHLNGVLFIDHLSPYKKNIISRKLIKITKGKFEELYPIVKK